MRPYKKNNAQERSRRVNRHRQATAGGSSRRCGSPPLYYEILARKMSRLYGATKDRSYSWSAVNVGSDDDASRPCGRGLEGESSHALAVMGLSTADAVRLLFHRIVAEQAFPLDLKVPNAETQAAIVEADELIRSRRMRFADAEESGTRECHVGGDFLLIYRPDEDAGRWGTIVFTRAGTHSDLFGE